MQNHSSKSAELINNHWAWVGFFLTFVASSGRGLRDSTQLCLSSPWTGACGGAWEKTVLTTCRKGLGSRLGDVLVLLPCGFEVSGGQIPLALRTMGCHTAVEMFIKLPSHAQPWEREMTVIGPDSMGGCWARLCALTG